mgnify:FL=1
MNHTITRSQEYFYSDANDGTRRPGRGPGALLDLPVPRSGTGICVSNRDGL